jgi:hypothetical protein
MTAMAEFSSLHFLKPLESMTGPLLSTSVKQTASLLQNAGHKRTSILPQKEEGETLSKALLPSNRRLDFRKTAQQRSSLELEFDTKPQR